MAISNGYATLAELKGYLKIEDSMEDTLLEHIVEAASRSIDRIANRRFYLDSSASARTYRPTNLLMCSSMTSDLLLALSSRPTRTPPASIRRLSS